ncbi:MAG: hypothetical protein ACRDD1_13860 [Planctomycetia bacterium]
MSTAPKQVQITKVMIRSWPKMFFFWPAMLVGLLVGLGTAMLPQYGELFGGFYMLILTMNFVVLTFEFPRTTSLTLFASIAAGVFLLVLLNQQFPVITPLADFFGNLHIMASPGFYFTQSFIHAFLLIGMYVNTRFDYWVLESNELVHHTGMLGDIERFSTNGLKFNKEIPDIFEYLISRAGRMVLVIPGTPRPIVLDNILNINRLEKMVDSVLEAKMVRMDVPNGGAGAAHQAAVQDEA